MVDFTHFFLGILLLLIVKLNADYLVVVGLIAGFAGYLWSLMMIGLAWVAGLRICWTPGLALAISCLTAA